MCYVGRQTFNQPTILYRSAVYAELRSHGLLETFLAYNDSLLPWFNAEKWTESRFNIAIYEDGTKSVTFAVVKIADSIGRI